MMRSKEEGLYYPAAVSACQSRHMEKYDIREDDSLDNKPEHQRLWAGESYLAAARPDFALLLYSHSLTAKGPAMYEEITHIPLIVKGFGENQVNSNPVSHINLAPTIMELFGLPVPKVMEGKSILQELTGEARVNDYIFMEFGRYEVDHDGFGGMALMALTALAASTMAGCAGKNDSTGTQAAQTTVQAAGTQAEGTQAAAAETEPQLEGSLISAEPKEFSIFLNFNNMPFDSNWQVWQEIARRTNISLKGTVSLTNSNEEEAFNLMLSSGQLADIIGYVNGSDLEKLGRDGGLIPLNDLIDQYAPNIKRVMEEDSRFRQSAYSLDGNIYYIPKNQELLSAEYWWIRQDWLDALGLEAPTTVDELHDVLYAFRNDDPNGNGLKDEIPLFDRAGWKQPEEYLYLWDTSTTFYPRDGKMTFEPLEENFKVGVKNLIQWYEEGILDPEFFTRGASGRDTLLSGNLGGCTHDWVSAGNYNKTLAEVIPGFEMVPFAPPADQNGVVKERVSRYPGVGWGISFQCEDPVTVIKFMDYFFSEEGGELVNWGIEGDTYTKAADGTKQFTDKVLESELTPIGYLRSIGAQYRIGMCQDGEYEKAVMTDIAKVASEMYDTHPEWFGEDMPPYADGELGLKYDAEDDTDYKNIMASIQPYVEEKFQSWVLGVSDFDAEYDEFVEELKARGIDRALEINQKAYDTYLNGAN